MTEQKQDPYLDEREKMIQQQIAARGINNPRVLEAFLRVPRHEFVPAALRDEAYADYPLPIGEGQTISQPFIVALMTQALALEGEEKVLEIGLGSGYQAAILACLAKEVFSIELRPSLAREGEKKLKELGFFNIQVKVGDGSLGWPEKAPFHAIIVTAAAPQVPPPLLEQLTEGGRLVIPLGPRGRQNLLRITKRKGELVKEDLGACVFVPLIGEYGWKD